jgi:hypothetical protein
MARGPRSRPRIALALAGALLLIVGAYACTTSIASQMQSSCACTYAPTHPPGWTPTPPPELSIAQAEAIASRIAGQPMRSYGSWDEFGGQPVLITHSANAYAYVNGNTGAVLTAFFADELLSGPGETTSADDALAAAAQWLSSVGVATDGTAPTVETKSAAGLPYFELIWTGRIEVLVNAGSGNVFGYRELGNVTIDVPLIGFTAARALAERSPLAHGEPASPGDMNNLLWDGDRWEWTIGFNDGALSVDSTTGEVAVMKWADQR